MSLIDELYTTLLESPLGVVGAEQTLPALHELLKEVRKQEFWAAKRKRRRLSEEQMIRAWAQYRRDLSELRDRLRQQQQGWDDLLSWLVLFLIDHYRQLAIVSATEQPAFELVFRFDADPPTALALRDDWQQWIVGWLRDALRDDDLDAGAPAKTSIQDDHPGDDDSGAAPKPKNPTPGIDL